MQTNATTKKSYTKETLKIFWQHTRPYWPAVLTSLILLHGAVGIEIYRPWIYKRLLDEMALPGGDFQLLLRLVALLVLIGAAAAVAQRLGTLLVNKYQAAAKQDLWMTAFTTIHKETIKKLPLLV